MKNLRTLLALIGVLVVVPVGATPALATFQANGANTTQGPLQLAAGTQGVFTTGGAAIACGELTKGEWHVQTKGETVEVVGGITKITQTKTKDGAHLALTGAVTKCAAEVAGLKLAIAVNPECTLQIRQVTATSFNGDVVARCVIKIPAVGCELTLPAGKPNFELSTIAVANVAAGTEQKANVTGITTTVNKACEEIGVTGNKEGTLKQTTIAHSLKIE